jgi:hypothetical protein
MSLKAFHIIFVTACVLLAFGFGAWLLNEYFANGGSLSYLVFGMVSFVTGVGLIVYGRYFLKKLKHVSYL